MNQTKTLYHQGDQIKASTITECKVVNENRHFALLCCRRGYVNGDQVHKQTSKNNLCYKCSLARNTSTAEVDGNVMSSQSTGQIQMFDLKVSDHKRILTTDQNHTC